MRYGYKFFLTLNLRKFLTLAGYLTIVTVATVFIIGISDYILPMPVAKIFGHIAIILLFASPLLLFAGSNLFYFYGKSISFLKAALLAIILPLIAAFTLFMTMVEATILRTYIGLPV